MPSRRHLHPTGFGLSALALLLLGCGDSTSPPAGDSRLTPPIAGTPMVDVFYGAFIDHARGGDPHDYDCGVKAFAGHTGVDILLRNFRVQDAGVPVIAAADGVVAVAVDGSPDRNTTWDAGGGLGNHVVLSHASGLVTLYGHLRRNSVLVTPGMRVERGAPLGMVGSSGTSNWPHLHFEVNRNGLIVEPFAGRCGAKTSLWESQLAYQDAYLVTDAGLTRNQVLTRAILLERPPDVDGFPLDVDAFQFWLQVANQRAGTMRFEFRRPGGDVAHEVRHPVTSTFSMRYLAVTVHVAGVLTEPGTWEIRTWQDDQLVWSQPFTILPAAIAAEEASGDARARSLAPAAFELLVLDQVPPDLRREGTP